jgi:Holliday junction resolvase
VNSQPSNNSPLPSPQRGEGGRRVNSRQKGARGERLWRDELRAHGFDARRGQQFSGSADSPDVVCPALDWAHFEVKAVERLNIEDAMDQARRDAAAKTPIVAHKRNHRRWLVTMDAETLFRLLRGEFDTSPSIPLPVRGGEGEVLGESPNTAGGSPALPISAAACAAANSDNQRNSVNP